MLILDGGSGEDPEGREGLAHLVEHLSLRASELREAHIHVDRFAQGITYNGATEHDAVVFTEEGPASSIHAMLWAEATRLSEPVAGLDETTFQVERNVVLNELRERSGIDASNSGTLAHLQVLFPQPHPYHRSVIGSPETLAAISLAEARKWAGLHYHPKGATLSVTGPLGLATVETFLTALVSPAVCGGFVPPGPVPSRGPANVDDVRASAPPTVVRARADVSLPELSVGWRVPGSLSPERDVADVWTTVLAEHLKVAELDDPDVASIDCTEIARVLGSVIDCKLKLSASTRPEDTTRRLLKAVERLNATLPEHLPRTKRLLNLRRAFENERPWVNARERAMASHFGGDRDGKARMPAWQTVTLADLRLFQQKYLLPELARATLVEPLPPGQGAPAPPAVDPPTVHRIDWSTTVKNALPELETLRFLTSARISKLSNGLVVVTVPRSSTNLVEVFLGFRVAVEDEEVSLAADDAVKTALDSPAAESGLEYHHWFRERNAGMIAFGTSAELEEGIDNLARAVLDYRIEWPSPKFLNESLPRFRERDRSPAQRAERRFLSSVLGDHPLAHRAPAEAIAATSSERLSEFVARTIAPSNAVLIVVGDMDPARVRAVADRAFAGWRPSLQPPIRWPAAALPGPPPAVPAAESTVLPVVEHPGASQAEIIQGCLLPPSDPKIDARYDLVAQVVADEMHASLREEAGGTYGVDGSAVSMVGGTAYLQVTTAVGNDALGVSLAATERFWAEIRTGSWRAQSVMFPQIARLRWLMFAFEDSERVAHRVFSDWLIDWPLTSLDAYGTNLLTVQPADVDEVLRHCAEHLVITITGDPNAIKTAVEGAARKR
jgi:zinc protease